ncbi:MAG: RES family NAD+ phosphorylase [Xanthomonadaceae bacterium]|nr:RES family NAD+ phosphorylase [Xanthomonadaceae bacterium]
MEIEGLTNDRLRQELGQIALVPEEDRVYGPGTTPIMAAFTHLNSEGSRFTDGSYGIYYASRTIETAVAETRFHRSRFLAATREPPIEIDMRSYASDIDADLHDIVGLRDTLPDIHAPDPANYGPAQAFARSLRDTGSNGIVYRSVRDPGGECMAVFRPRIMQPVIQCKHFCYVWNGEQITDVYIKTEYP